MRCGWTSITTGVAPGRTTAATVPKAAKAGTMTSSAGLEWSGIDCEVALGERRGELGLRFQQRSPWRRVVR